MKVTKIIQVLENTNDYHVVFVYKHGNVTIERAAYMALVTLKNDNGTESEEMLPMVHSSEGYLYVCHSGMRKYAGIARPGDDALFIAEVSPLAGDAYDAWLEREGITKLIVPGGGR